MRFSDRLGITAPPVMLYIEEMPQELKVSLWNFIVDMYNPLDGKYWKKIVPHMARYFRKYPVDELPYTAFDLKNWFKLYFFSLTWYDAYNLLEFLVRNHDVATREYDFNGFMRPSHPKSGEKIALAMNVILEREYSGYRFISQVLTPITDKVELDEVQRATQLSGNGLQGAKKHIMCALDLFSQKPHPDFRNAVKEAISAIESIAKQLGSPKGAGLAPALKALDDAVGIHGALRSAFEKLYGYSSDEKGIRHSLFDDVQTQVGFEEAKYMIVSCSAFANYLAGKAEKAGLLT